MAAEEARQPQTKQKFKNRISKIPFCRIRKKFCFRFLFDCLFFPAIVEDVGTMTLVHIFAKSIPLCRYHSVTCDGRTRTDERLATSGWPRPRPPCCYPRVSAREDVRAATKTPMQSLCVDWWFFKFGYRVAPEATQRDSCYHIGYRHRGLNYFLCGVKGTRRERRARASLGATLDRVLF